jgi:hypothetical protein
MRRTWPRIVVGLAVIAVGTACGSPGSAPVARPGESPSAGRPAVSTPATALVAASPVWRTDPVTETNRPSVPPVPVLTEVRYAGHPEDGYDRIVFDIEGGLPGYSARYVDEVRADPSDRRLSVPGKKHLLVVFTPMRSTVTGVHRAGLPMLTSYVMAGDFEGHVSIALGLAGRTGFRIVELPGRIYIDVAN